MREFSSRVCNGLSFLCHGVYGFNGAFNVGRNYRAVSACFSVSCFFSSCAVTPFLFSIEPLKNVVFMGMGEPLDNYAEVLNAIR